MMYFVKCKEVTVKGSSRFAVQSVTSSQVLAVSLSAPIAEAAHNDTPMYVCGP